MDIALGQVVYSKAGRDSGRKFIVIGFLNEDYALVADGDLRRMDKPKKKKLKHLAFEKEIVIPINEKLTNKQKISNAELRKFLTAGENT